MTKPKPAPKPAAPEPASPAPSGGSESQSQSQGGTEHTSPGGQHANTADTATSPNEAAAEPMETDKPEGGPTSG